MLLVSGCDWLGPICRSLAQSGLLVFTSRLVGKGYTTINLVPTPQVKRVSSSQRLPVEFTEDCCSTLQMCSLGCFSKDLSILSLVTGTLIYSSTGTAYKGGSEGKTNKGGSPVAQGRKDRSPRMRRDTGETKREGPGKVSDMRESGTTRRSVT